MKFEFQIRRSTQTGKMSRRGLPIFTSADYRTVWRWGWQFLARSGEPAVHVAVVAPGYQPAAVAMLIGFDGRLTPNGGQALAWRLSNPTEPPSEARLERLLLRARLH